MSPGRWRNFTEKGVQLMEYSRDEKNRIRAGFALNAGRLLEQYSRLSAGVRASERYDATLTICILQSLLTNCWELLKAMGAS